MKSMPGVNNGCQFLDSMFNKVNVPVLRRDLVRIKVSLCAWDRAHEDSIRAALVPGRGANAIRRTQSGIARMIQTCLTKGFYTEANLKAHMVPVGMHPTHCWVWTFEENMVILCVVTKRTSIRGGRPSSLRSSPEGVTDLLASKLAGWVVGFYVGSGDWGSGLYGIVEPLPAIEMVAGEQQQPLSVFT
eukprot:1148298-Pelagomonas_calceolata.AAC.1